MGLVSEKQVGFLLGVGGVGQDGVMAGGMVAEDDFGAGWLFEAEAFGANGDAAIVADFDWGADAPDLRPPRTDRRGAQHGTLGFQCRRPRRLRRLAQLPMHFLGIVVVVPRRLMS